MAKFCKDCKFFSFDPETDSSDGMGKLSLCKHEKARNIVSGEPRECYEMRGDSDSCGPNAKWFKAKETE